MPAHLIKRYQSISGEKKNKKWRYSLKKFQNTSEEEKKQEYCGKRYKNICEDEKQKPVKYRTNYSLTLKYNCSVVQ